MGQKIGPENRTETNIQLPLTQIAKLVKQHFNFPKLIGDLTCPGQQHLPFTRQVDLFPRTIKKPHSNRGLQGLDLPTD